MDEKTYVINDKFVVKEEYLKMSKEELNRAIQKILDEDAAKRNKSRQAMVK